MNKAIIYPPIKQIKVDGKYQDVDSLKTLGAYKSQGFLGNNVRACDFVRGASCSVSLYQYFGKRSHGAIDWPQQKGMPILAAHDGIVYEKHDDRGSGLGLVIWDPKQLIKTYYWHNDFHNVRLNQEVKAGQEIAGAGTTGYSTGVHIHFVMKFTDQDGNTLNKANGWQGAVDPMPFMQWWEHDDIMARLVRAENQNDIYKVVNTDHGPERDLYTDAEAFERLAGKGRFADVEVISETELNAIPRGYNIVIKKDA